MPDRERELDRLFELPPEEFVEARNDLAKRLTGEGEKELAREVKSLRRPSVAAWAVNQLVRRHSQDLDRLLQAGAALREAHAQALAGKKVDLREPGERRRSVVAALMQAAEELLESSGRDSSATRESIETTLEAAAVDEDAASAVRAGRLSKELPPAAGFGATDVLTAFGDTEGGAKKDRKQIERAARQAADEAERAERRAREARERAGRLRRDADQAERRAVEAERKANEAEAEAARVQEEASAADRALRHTS